jgi:hypothetical protein
MNPGERSFSSRDARKLARHNSAFTLIEYWAFSH